MDETLGTIRPEDFFAYTYALLVSPSYVERFSEELLYSQPRVPITKNRELFDKAASLGRQLIWLHTFGERLIPVGKRKGTTPQGRARSTKAIPQNPTGYPDSNPTFDPETQTVYFGEGEFAPVSQDVWDYEVSGYHVAQAWLKSRRRSGSGKKSSPLDDIRPTQWTAEMTEEFLRLLWIIEATISMHAGLEKTLDAVLADECFKNSELPEPRVIEQKPPEKGVHEQHALDF
jgi:predicted helicase